MCTSWQRSCVIATYPMMSFNRNKEVEIIPNQTHVVNCQRAILRSTITLGQFQVFISFVLAYSKNYRKMRRAQMGCRLGPVCSRLVETRRKQLWRVLMLLYAQKMQCSLPKESRSVQRYSWYSRRKKVVPSFRQSLLLSLWALCNLLQLTGSPSLLRNRYCKKDGMLLSSCVMELIHWKPCWLLRIIKNAAIGWRSETCGHNS